MCPPTLKQILFVIVRAIQSMWTQSFQRFITLPDFKTALKIARYHIFKVSLQTMYDKKLFQLWCQTKVIGTVF